MKRQFRKSESDIDRVNLFLKETFSINGGSDYKFTQEELDRMIAQNDLLFNR